MGGASVTGDLPVECVCAGSDTRGVDQLVSYEQPAAAIVVADGVRDRSACDCLASAGSMESWMAFSLAVLACAARTVRGLRLSQKIDDFRD